MWPMKTLTIILINCILLSWVSTAQAQGVTGSLLARINELRASRGLAPYTLNGALNTAALNHAQWMTRTNNVSHIQDDGSRPSDRARAAGYNSTFVSENIYMGGSSGINSAWTFWVNSAIHYAGLTSSNYQHVGIGSASGAGGTAFVLVFGSPGGASRVLNSSTAGNSSNAEAGPAAAPSFVVGWDEYGNIMHQVQPGDTLGDIALIYGYTWDDIPTVLALNELTEADIRGLDIGSVLLVPPQSGTYTPVPVQASATPTVVATEAPEQTEAIVLSVDSSPTAPVTETPTVLALDEEPSRESVLVPPVQYIMPTTTPTVLPTLAMIARPVGTEIATVDSASSSVLVNSASIAEPPTPTSNPPLWLVAVIVAQLGVLGLAGAEFLRRLLK